MIVIKIIEFVIYAFLTLFSTAVISMMIFAACVFATMK
jgi:hypothetical protein